MIAIIDRMALWLTSDAMIVIGGLAAGSIPGLICYAALVK